MLLPSLFLCFVFPLLARRAARRAWVPAWVSPIIACYGVGILVSNLRLWPVDSKFLESVAGAAMVVGLPLLLFAVDLRRSFRFAGRMLLAFGLCCLAGLVCTAAVGVALSGTIADAHKIAGMLVGLYTGGTPNVQAIAVALAAPYEYVVLVQAADVLLGGAYLLGLITVLPALYARFYPCSAAEDAAPPRTPEAPEPARRQGLQLLAAAGVVLLSLGVVYALTGGVSDVTALILSLTTLGLAVSLSPLPARIGNSYPLGEYFILVFSVALGLMADFRTLANQGRELLYFSALALAATTLLHLVLCRLFRLDRDTVILSSVAAFYGPVFVVQVAAALGNQRLLAAGVAVSLLGFGLGNYLGIGLAEVVYRFAG